MRMPSFIIALLAFCQLGWAQPVPSASERLQRLKREYQRSIRQELPGVAIQMGLHPRKPGLPDLSEKKREEKIKMRRALAEIQRDHESLSVEERMDLRLMCIMVDKDLHELIQWKGHLRNLVDAGMGLDPANGFQAQIAQMMGPQDALLGWKEILSQGRDLERYLTQHRQNLERGLAEGIVPDRRMVEEEIKNSLAMADFFVRELVTLARQTLAPGDFKALRPEIQGLGASGDKLYQAYAAFLRERVLPVSKENQYPLGEIEYARRLRLMGILQTPDQIHEQGLAIAKKIRSRMEELAAQIAPDKNLEQLLDEIAKDHPENDKKVLKEYEAATAKAQRFVQEHGLFKLPRGYKLKIVPTPKAQRSTTPMAAYFMAPPFDKKKQGVFLVTPTEGDSEKLKDHNRAEILSTAVHEAFPGHDLQYYSFQRRGKKASQLPSYFDYVGGWASALNAEGYALYAEELMRQKGFFSPREELIALKSQLWRAYRMVVDTWMHTGKMSFDEVVRVLHEEAFLSLPIAREEAFRYSNIPTQAVTYMIGRLQIEQLKKDYQEILGPHYSEKKFHQEFFGYGAAPPAIIAPAMLEKARQERAVLESTQARFQSVFKDSSAD